jgi:alanine dehydrogenase
VVSIAREGIQSVLRRHQGLRQGVYLLNGKVMQQSVAEIFRLPLHSLEEELGL